MGEESASVSNKANRSGCVFTTEIYSGVGYCSLSVTR